MMVVARNNPFAVDLTDSIPFCFHGSGFDNLESFAKHVADANYRGAIIGNHGSGKTTLLCNLHALFREQAIDSELALFPREKISRKTVFTRLVQRGNTGAIVMVDGIERLSFCEKRHFIRQSRTFGGLIATVHRKGSWPTLIHCKPSHHLLETVLAALSIDDPIIHTTGKSLLSTHKGNVRSVLRELYDMYALGQFAPR